MNTSRRVLTIVCLGLSLMLVIVVRFELRTSAASGHGNGGSLVPSVSALGDETKPSLALAVLMAFTANSTTWSERKNHRRDAQEY